MYACTVYCILNQSFYFHYSIKVDLVIDLLKAEDNVKTINDPYKNDGFTVIHVFGL